jgi:tryptophan synthase alpha chain
LHTTLEPYGIAPVLLLAPTSDGARVRLITGKSKGFVYLVSLTGITGARDTLPVELESFVQRVRGATDLPLAVGFGIGTPAQAKRVAHVADGVIVGSALVKALASQNPIESARAFVRSLRQDMDTNHD